MSLSPTSSFTDNPKGTSWELDDLMGELENELLLDELMESDLCEGPDTSNTETMYFSHGSPLKQVPMEEQLNCFIVPNPPPDENHTPKMECEVEVSGFGKHLESEKDPFYFNYMEDGDAEPKEINCLSQQSSPAEGKTPREFQNFYGGNVHEDDDKEPFYRAAIRQDPHQVRDVTTQFPELVLSNPQVQLASCHVNPAESENKAVSYRVRNGTMQVNLDAQCLNHIVVIMHQTDGEMIECRPVKRCWSLSQRERERACAKCRMNKSANLDNLNPRKQCLFHVDDDEPLDTYAAHVNLLHFAEVKDRSSIIRAGCHFADLFVQIFSETYLGQVDLNPKNMREDVLAEICDPAYHQFRQCVYRYRHELEVLKSEVLKLSVRRYGRQRLNHNMHYPFHMLSHEDRVPVPVETTADGSGFYHSISQSLYSSEELSNLLKVLLSFDMLNNDFLYTPISRSHHKYLKNMILWVLKRGQCATSLVAILMSIFLKRPILSFGEFSRAPESKTTNFKFVGAMDHDGNEPIMIAHVQASEGSKQNHFVPLLKRNETPLIPALNTTSGLLTRQELEKTKSYDWHYCGAGMLYRYP